MDTKLLYEIGLSKAQVKLYLSLLSHGSLTAAQLSSRSGVYRPSVYDNIPGLLELGLVGTNIKLGVRHYYPLPPEKIEHVFREKQERIKELVSGLKSEYRQPKHAEEVIVYEGNEGYKSYLSEFFNQLENRKVSYFYGIWSADEKVFKPAEGFTRSMMRLVEEEYKPGVKPDMKVLINSGSNPFAKLFPYFSYRRLPSNLSFHASTDIMDTGVAFLIHRPRFLIVLVKSGELAITYKNLFELLWERSSQL